jgi:hypothetical protein
MDGSKKWEFRENPEFGRTGEYLLETGDHILIISTGKRSIIPCVCVVEDIKKGDDYNAFFGSPDPCIWYETGCPEDEEEANEFRNLIRCKYKTAVRLKNFNLNTPVDVSAIVHLHTGKSWSGRGFGHISQLKRFGIKGVKLEEYFTGIINALI